MRTITTILLIIISLQLGVAQNCIPTAIVFTTQQEVDDFPSDYPGCTIIDGSVGISGDVINLDSLIQVVEIGGNVLINNSTTLNDLTGLMNLTKIEGFLKLENLPALISISGFDNLTKIGEGLELATVDFPNIDPLINLDTIGGDFSFIDQGVNCYIDGLDSLKFLGGNLILKNKIRANGMLESLTEINGYLDFSSITGSDPIEMPGLTSINSYFSINNSTNISALNFPLLETTGGYFDIRGCGNNSSFSFPLLESVNGYFRIYNNGVLTADFDMLESVNGYFEWLINDSKVIDKFSSLSSIAGNMNIGFSGFLRKINTFENLASVSNIYFSNSSKLDTIIGFDSLVTTQEFEMVGLKLGHFVGFQNLTTVKSFRFNACNGLDTLNFDGLQAYEETSYIQNNPVLKHVTFANLVSMDRLFFLDNATLQSFDDGNNVTSARAVSFRDNPILTSVTGFQQLATTATLEFENNDFLADISGFDHPIDITNILEIQGNSFLNVCNVQAVCDHLSQTSYNAVIANNATDCNTVNEILALCPNPPDTDGDNVPDYIDNCDDVPNPDQTDSNNNGIGDACEPFTDSDGDGISNTNDNCPNDFNPDQEDSNDNGIGDVCDTASDTDNDGVPDNQDNCPAIANPDQSDINDNGIGDVCDTGDSDGDGVADNMDNCPNTPNADQTDSDGDGIGDACIPPLDEDGDGVPDASDNCVGYYNPNQTDINNNGIGDACETTYKVGVGTDNPKSELHLSNGNLFIDNPAKGIVFMDHDGQCYLLKVKKINGIARSTIAAVPCPE